VLRTLVLVACWVVGTGAWICANQTAAIYPQKGRTFHSVEQFKKLTQGRVRVTRSMDQLGRVDLSRMNLPDAAVTVVASESPSMIWIGSRRGAFRVNRETWNGEYLAGQRWLPDDHVTGIGFDGPVIWIETAQGYSRLEYRHMTLAEKSRAFVDRIQARHVRWGLTADSRLRVAGDVSSNQPISTDNDGLWTAMYVAAESFRFKVTGAEDARANARAGMHAIRRLESMTGIPGFPARSFIRIGTDEQPADGEWHDTPDGWRWKGDTSSDEIVGHYFVYPIYHDLVADDAERRQLRETLTRITNHILDHNYQLVESARGRRRPADPLGLVGAGADLERSGRNRLEGASHPVAPPSGDAPGGRCSVAGEVSGGVRDVDRKSSLPPAHP
jgi:hypothetical protein